MVLRSAFKAVEEALFAAGAKAAAEPTRAKRAATFMVDFY
jgi:hypothetical protein